jgi:hypothetical protein
MPKYKFHMFTDFDFTFTYFGKPTKYCDDFTLLFDFAHKPNIKRIIDFLDRIEIIDNTRHSKDAIKRFELLKKEIRKGNLNAMFGGNYSFSFTHLDEEYDDIIKD